MSARPGRALSGADIVHLAPKAAPSQSGPVSLSAMIAFIACVFVIGVLLAAGWAHWSVRTAPSMIAKAPQASIALSRDGLGAVNSSPVSSSAPAAESADTGPAVAAELPASSKELPPFHPLTDF